MRGFDEAFEITLGHEGRYVNNPNAWGGATMWSITERLAREGGPTGDMRSMPVSEAKLTGLDQSAKPMRQQR